MLIHQETFKIFPKSFFLSLSLSQWIASVYVVPAIPTDITTQPPAVPSLKSEGRGAVSGGYGKHSR